MNTEWDPQTLAWLDQQDRMITEMVRRHGWAVQAVMGEGTEPPFAYTVGLFGLHHPELIVFGLGYSSAVALLNVMGSKVRENGDLSPGDVVHWEGTDTRVRVDALPRPAELLFAANRYYQRPDEASVPALQLTWDINGAFPGESGYSKPDWLQPHPGATGGCCRCPRWRRARPIRGGGCPSPRAN